MTRLLRLGRRLPGNLRRFCSTHQHRFEMLTMTQLVGRHRHTTKAHRTSPIASPNDIGAVEKLHFPQHSIVWSSSGRDWSRSSGWKACRPNCWQSFSSRAVHNRWRCLPGRLAVSGSSFRRRPGNMGSRSPVKRMSAFTPKPLPVQRRVTCETCTITSETGPSSLPPTTRVRGRSTQPSRRAMQRRFGNSVPPDCYRRRRETTFRPCWQQSRCSARRARPPFQRRPLNRANWSMQRRGPWIESPADQGKRVDGARHVSHACFTNAGLAVGLLRSVVVKISSDSGRRADLRSVRAGYVAPAKAPPCGQKRSPPGRQPRLLNERCQKPDRRRQNS